MKCNVPHTLVRLLPAATIAVLGTFWAGPVPAGVPEAYRKQWSDPAIQKRIEQNIERYRQADAVLEVLGPDGRPLPGAALEIRQQTHAFLFGCNAFVLGQLDTPQKNAKYEQAFAKLFNFATVPFYWEGTEPTQGELRYAEGCRDVWRRPPADRYPPFAKKYGITLKGHPLLWHAYNPPWLPADAEVRKQLYQKRFSEIATRYASQIAIWDVVNESLVSSAKFPLFTPDRAYVGWAFGQAHQRFRPENTLMINEVTSVSHVAKEQNAYYRQVHDLQQQGAGIQGIGFQFHLFSPKSLAGHLEQGQYGPQALLDVYEAFGDFGLPLFVTEITIPTAGDDGPAVQAEVVRNLYRLWFSAPRMAGITWWNLGDGTAVKHENTAQGGLVDENLDPKPSYRALDQLINHDWKTRLSTRTGSDGKAAFRGFCGKYQVRVSAGGPAQEFEIELAAGKPASHKLAWKPPR